MYLLGIFISWEIKLCGKVDLEWNISSNSVDWFLCHGFEGAVIIINKRATSVIVSIQKTSYDKSLAMIV